MMIKVWVILMHQHRHMMNLQTAWKTNLGFLGENLLLTFLYGVFSFVGDKWDDPLGYVDHFNDLFVINDFSLSEILWDI